MSPQPESSSSSMLVDDIGTDIRLLTLHRPEKRNALGTELLESLSHALVDVDRDATIRAIVLTGSGEAFAAGADISEYARFTQQEFGNFTRLANDVCRQLTALSVPTIAAVNGLALGGGFEIALACDIILASSTASFGLPEVELGLIPGWGGTQLLVRRLGPYITREIILAGGRISPDRAASLGIVNRVAPPEQLLETAVEMAQGIASRAPLAVRALRMAVLAETSSNQRDTAGFGYEQTLVESLFLTSDAREGVGAFMEKRQPKFTGV